MTNPKAGNLLSAGVLAPERATLPSGSLRSSSPTASTYGMTENGRTRQRRSSLIGLGCANETARKPSTKRNGKFPRRTLWSWMTSEANRTSSRVSKASADCAACLGHASTNGSWSTRTFRSRNGHTSSTHGSLIGLKRCITSTFPAFQVTDQN
mgnify:CR=1 FL=1